LHLPILVLVSQYTRFKVGHVSEDFLVENPFRRLHCWWPDRFSLQEYTEPLSPSSSLARLRRRMNHCTPPIPTKKRRPRRCAGVFV